MSTPTQNGVYVAEPVGIVIEEKTTGSVQANIQFKLTEYRGPDGKSSDPCDFTFTAYMNLVTKAGKLNEINARSFRESLGWDGKSFSSLANMDFTDVRCQVVVGDGTDQNGSTKREIKFINPIDYVPGAAVVSDPAAIQSLDAKYGAMLRATAGNGPSKPNGKAASSKPAASSIDTAKQVAYAKYMSLVDEYGRENPSNVYTTGERTEVFKYLATEYGKKIGKEPKAFDAADFAAFKTQIEERFTPSTREFCPF